MVLLCIWLQRAKGSRGVAWRSGVLRETAAHRANIRPDLLHEGCSQGRALLPCFTLGCLSLSGLHCPGCLSAILFEGVLQAAGSGRLGDAAPLLCDGTPGWVPQRMQGPSYGKGYAPCQS